MTPRNQKWYNCMDWSRMIPAFALSLLAGSGSSVGMDAYRQKSEAATIGILLDRLDSVSSRIDRVQQTVSRMDSAVRNIESWKIIAQRKQDSIEIRKQILYDIQHGE